MIKIPKNYKLVLIEWVDSYGVGSQWESLDNIQDEQHINYSAGWLIGNGKNVKVIVPHIQPEHPEIDAELMGCGDMAIPVQAIIKISELKIK